jgi:hypothetical protein
VAVNKVPVKNTTTVITNTSGFLAMSIPLLLYYFDVIRRRHGVGLALIVEA